MEIMRDNNNNNTPMNSILSPTLQRLSRVKAKKRKDFTRPNGASGTAVNTFPSMTSVAPSVLRGKSLSAACHAQWYGTCTLAQTAMTDTRRQWACATCASRSSCVARADAKQLKMPSSAAAVRFPRPLSVVSPAPVSRNHPKEITIAMIARESAKSPSSDASGSLTRKL